MKKPLFDNIERRILYLNRMGVKSFSGDKLELRLAIQYLKRDIAETKLIKYLISKL